MKATTASTVIALLQHDMAISWLVLLLFSCSFTALLLGIHGLGIESMDWVSNPWTGYRIHGLGMGIHGLGIESMDWVWESMDWCSERTLTFSYFLFYLYVRTYRRATNVEAAYGDALLAIKYHVEEQN